MNTKPYSKKRTLWTVFGAYLLICSVWAVYRFFVEAPLSVLFDPGFPTAALLEGLVKSLLYILPPLILMNRMKEGLEILPKQVFGFSWKTILFGLGLGLLFFVFYSARAVLVEGGIRYDFRLSADTLIGAVFFAAITEEILCRAFILNALVKKIGRGWAHIITAVLFALMHLPIWIAGGTTSLQTLLLNLLSTGCIGYLLGLVFLHSGGIWGAVAAHALHNFIIDTIKPPT